MADLSPRRLVIGTTLLMAGLYWLVQQLFSLPASISLLFWGSGFVLLYYLRGRNRLGFLFLGCLLINLGILYTLFGLGILRESLDWPFELVAIGLSFIFLWILAGPQQINWPLIPGLTLILLGGLLLMHTWGFIRLDLALNPRLFADLFLRFWPALLILSGFVLILKS